MKNIVSLKLLTSCPWWDKMFCSSRTWWYSGYLVLFTQTAVITANDGDIKNKWVWREHLWAEPSLVSSKRRPPFAAKICAKPVYGSGNACCVRLQTGTGFDMSGLTAPNRVLLAADHQRERGDSRSITKSFNTFHCRPYVALSKSP